MKDDDTHTQSGAQRAATLRRRDTRLARANHHTTPSTTAANQRTNTPRITITARHEMQGGLIARYRTGGACSRTGLWIATGKEAELMERRIRR